MCKLFVYCESQNELKDWKPDLKVTFNTTKLHGYSDDKHVAEVSAALCGMDLPMNKGLWHSAN